MNQWYLVFKRPKMGNWEKGKEEMGKETLSET